MSSITKSNNILSASLANLHEEKIWKILESVFDPEVPVLSIIDLGIVRQIKYFTETEVTEVTITPTYSGCPAMDHIALNIRLALLQQRYSNIKINTILSPAWTTDWMTEAGREKLKIYGIAPPVGKSFNQQYLEDLVIGCPQCHSKNTQLISQFGSTSCKALFKCNDCQEPFDYFKCH